MRFYTTNEQWFGMTYKEDRELVKTKIKEKLMQVSTRKVVALLTFPLNL